MSKRFFRSFLSSLLALMMVVSLAAIPSSAASLTLNKTTASVTKGYAITLTAKGASGTVKWSTGNKSIATVTSKGKVVGKKAGTTYIYAKTSSQTAKCKVTVVAGKITAQSSVSMAAGDKTTVRIKALGTHAISAKSADKSIVKATWSGAKFSGNYIYLTLTAIGSGTTTVKVYSKTYSNVYTNIKVTVDSGDLDDDDDTDTTTPSGPVTLVQLSDSVKLSVAEKTTAKVYCSVLNGVNCTIADQSIATATVVASTTNTIPITITGVKAGTTTLRVYSKTNSAKYVDIPVTVAANASEYYKIYDTVPTVLIPTDTTLRISINNVMKYMLVPTGYDPAYVNDIIAESTSSYSYYTLYTKYPTKRTSTDLVQTVTTTFSNVNVVRYIMTPVTSDTVQYNTAIAAYAGKYEYYKIYSTSPTKLSSTDEIRSWTIKDSNNVSTSRFMLAPSGQSYSDYANKIVDDDMSANKSFAYYTVYTSAPTGIDYNTEILFTWSNPTTGATKYMVYPKTNFDFVKRNDLVAQDTGYYNYFNVYSTSYIPKYRTTDDVILVNVTTGGKSYNGYMLVDTADSNYQANYNNALSGVYSYSVQTA